MGSWCGEIPPQSRKEWTPLRAARRSRLRFIRAAEAARERLVWDSQHVICPIGTRDSSPEREGGHLLERAPRLVMCLDAAEDFRPRKTSRLKFQLSINESIVSNRIISKQVEI